MSDPKDPAVGGASPPSNSLNAELFDLFTLMPDSQLDAIVQYAKDLRAARGGASPLLADIQRWGKMLDYAEQHHGESAADALTFLRRELSYIPASPAPGWQPIETAPKDGTPLLLLEPAELTGRTLYGHFVAAAWMENRNYKAGGYWSDGCNTVRPTHWMPLPDPPAGGSPSLETT